MADYGLLITGFVPKPQDVCRQEINEAIRAKRGLSTDVSDGSLLGQLSGILSEREATLWDLAQALYSSRDPDTATGTAQDAICALTGTIRASAKSSTVTETLTGTPTTVVGAGSQVKTASTGALFSSSSSAIIASLAAWTITTGYTVGQRVTNASHAYQCITTGTSAGAGGPTTTAADITDGTVHWRYLGDGTGAVDAAFLSVDKAAVVATSGDLTVIQTPVGGWQGAINVLDAVPGAVVQPDGLLRLTREAELASSGNSPPDAIRAAVFGVLGVTSCTVFYNNTDLTDSNGIPPHSVHVVVEGGDDTAIATTLSSNVAAGIGTIGSTTVAVNDSQGTPHDYKFTRPAAVNVYQVITLTYDSRPSAQGGYPSDGNDQVTAALVAFGNTLPIGKDVVAASLQAAAFPLFVGGSLVAGVQGVLDVTSMLVYTDVIGSPVAWAPTTGYVATPGARSVVTNDGRTYICITGGTSAGSGGPTGTGTDITDGTVHWRYLGASLSVTLFQRAAFDTSRTTVNSSGASPTF